MLPTLTEEQRLLKESLERFRQQDYTFEKRKGLLAKLGAKDDPVWAQFAELGWLAATLPEEHGGLGGSHADLALLMEQFGRGLVTSPFVPTRRGRRDRAPAGGERGAEGGHPAGDRRRPDQARPRLPRGAGAARPVHRGHASAERWRRTSSSPATRSRRSMPMSPIICWSARGCSGSSAITREFRCSSSRRNARVSPSTPIARTTMAGRPISISIRCACRRSALSVPPGTALDTIEGGARCRRRRACARRRSAPCGRCTT